MTRRFRLAALAALGLGPGTSAALAQAEPAPVVVYLVRHAEKLDDSRDPPLNDAGRLRVDALVRTLQDAGITHVWSTAFRRTRATAAPVAARLGLAVAPYDPADLGAVAAGLRATPGRHLVVGHSNTTPALVRALGGDPMGDISDAEYDRLYLLVIAGSRVTTSLLRYGEP
jgi:phosphohistidine phosphatase SixA